MLLLGSTFPNRDEALSFVHDACYNNGGMFTGNFAARQSKSMCPALEIPVSSLWFRT
ncbi:unnamed protein product [Aureobasidium pullulans]|nr:unnamed protein product [Aureobasidium pullulans]